VQAAQVSAKGENNPETVPARLIKSLMKGRHGSPFEHTSFTFFVKAPIFVFREWQRHRMSSFNEWSGRYSEMLPEFYVPGANRVVINTGTKMQPNFDPDRDYCGYSFPELDVREALEEQAEEAWVRYQKMLRNGIANEVARMVLPLNVYSQMYWTVNARSLMNFLSLRVESEESLVRSYPQWEIQMGAEKVEEHFKTLMPATYAAFVKNGRVAP
jgi:thymidylate synthase (FAD)